MWTLVVRAEVHRDHELRPKANCLSVYKNHITVKKEALVKRFTVMMGIIVGTVYDDGRIISVKPTDDQQLSLNVFDKGSFLF